MSVDSRMKGARAEADLAKKLSTAYGLNFKRVPASGALHESHGLKGDLYIPNATNIYAIEIKHYKDDHLTSSVLTSKNPQLIAWWSQAVRQGLQVGRKPMLFFKFDRSKFFVALNVEPEHLDLDKYMIIKHDNFEFIVFEFEYFIENVDVKWLA